MKKFVSGIKLLDIAVIAAMLCVAAFFVVSAGGKEGRPKRLILIHGDNTTTLSWKNNIINLNELIHKQMMMEVKDGRARVISSSCPDKLCVHSGWISECGHIAACLPNNVAIMVDCSENLNVTNP